MKKEMSGEDKLHIMRILMKERGYNAYIIPHGDQHDNEYIAESDERIKFISNFSGSNGIGLVTETIALMWTDGRYYIQIEKELYPDWKMKKMGRGEESLTDYIVKNLPKNCTIGMDFSLFSLESALKIRAKLKDYILIDDTNNLIDDIWGTLKPKYKTNKVLILPVEFTGKSVNEKYKMVEDSLKNNTEAFEQSQEQDFRLFISKLDDIAWLLNLRGDDIPYNPVFFSYALFCKIKGEYCTKLFVNKIKFDSDDIQKYCQNNKIILYDYEKIIEELEKSSDDLITFFDESINYRIFRIITELKQIKHYCMNTNIIEDMKSVKNKVEIEGYRKANLKDCVSLIKFFSWMEEELVTKNRKDLNEYNLCINNKQSRDGQENYMGESFAPICAGGANAAIIHYEPNENVHSNVNKDMVILCDTGGQYKEGTTDITRTVHYGKPTKEEKEMYTRVLLGNLSLERTLFRKGRSFENLDPIARLHLYMVGKDYLHGTTHGVGHFLNVHEGPYGKELKAGNVITNEPGYYEKDKFGIRIENEVLVVEKSEKLLGFENLTFLPYERNLIDLDLVSNDFKNYINNFHKKCFDLLSPHLKNEPKALNYLKKKTEPL